MHAKKFAWLVILATPSVLYGQRNMKTELTTSEAKEHVGESATVCGKVVGAKISRYSAGSYGKPITFFLDEPEAFRTFSFGTLTNDPTKFEQVKETYQGKRVCVTGKIMMLGNAPYINAMQPSQIEMRPDEKK
jgi:hypothetical protein